MNMSTAPQATIQRQSHTSVPQPLQKSHEAPRWKGEHSRPARMAHRSAYAARVCVIFSMYRLSCAWSCAASAITLMMRCR